MVPTRHVPATENSFWTNFYGNRQHPRDERCVPNVTSISGINKVGPLKEVGWGSEREGWPWCRETGAEFEGRLCRNPIERPPKRAEGNYRERDSNG